MKTTMMGVLTIFAAVCAAAMSYLKTGVLGPEVVTGVLTAIGAGVGLIHAADAPVEPRAGKDPSGFPAVAGPARSTGMAMGVAWLLTAVAIPGAFLAVMFLSGCSTTTGDAARDARGRATNAALEEATKVLGRVAVNTLANVAQQEMSGGGADFGSAAAAGLWANAGSIVSSEAIAHIIEAYSGKRLPETAAKAAVVFSEGAGEAEVKAGAIASVISTAAGAPPGQ